MVDPSEFFSWLVVMSIFVIGPSLILRFIARRDNGSLMPRVLDWVERHRAPDVDGEYEVDTAPELRTERLYADVQRVQRILADDEWMSATRQVANRMAYDRLLLDLRAARARVDELDGLGELRVDLVSVGRGADAPIAPVETIEISWRR